MNRIQVHAAKLGAFSPVMFRMSVMLITHIHLVSKLLVYPLHALLYLYCDKGKTEQGGLSSNASNLQE
jgi:hypothetical protein